MTSHPTTSSPNSASPKRRTLRGQVIRRSGDKTVAVEVGRVKVHPLYQRRRVTSKRYLAHDANNTAQVGDTVVIQESRPLSARKRWVIIRHQDQPGKATL